jgi:rod shape-determining protein MreD
VNVGVRIASAAIVVVTALLQASLVWRLDVMGVVPDLLIVVVASLALLTGPLSGAACGFGAGIAFALFAALPLGPHAMLGTLIGFGIGRVGEQLITDDHPAPPLLAAMFATVTMQLGRPLLEFLLNPGMHGVEGMWRSTIIATAIGAMLAVPVYIAVRRMLVAAAQLAGTDNEVLA